MNLNRFHLRSLKARITLLTLLIFVLSLWSLAFLSNNILRKDMERLLGDQQFSTVTMLAKQINQELDNRINWLDGMTTHFSVILKNNPEKLQAVIEQHPILHTLFNNGVFVVGRNGSLLAEFPLTGKERPGDSIDTEVVTATIESGKPTFGRPKMNAQNARTLTLAVPIRDDLGQVVGCLGGITNLDAPNFIDQVTESRYGQTGGVVLLIPQDRIVISATDKSRIMEILPALGINPALDRFRNGYEGSAIYKNSKGVEVLGSAKQIPASGWLLATTLPTEEAFLPIRTLQIIVVLALLIMTFLVGWLIWWMLKRQLSPLLNTAKALTSMAENPELSPRIQALPVAEYDEVSQVINSFNRFQEALAQRAAALQENYDVLNTVLNTTLDGFWRVDLQGRLCAVNPTYCRQSGYSKDELLGMSISELDALESSADTALRMERIIRDGGDLFESKHHRKDGSTWDVEVNITYHDSKGGGFFVFLRDVTERKQTAEALRQYRTHLEQLVSERTQQNETILNNALVGIAYVKHGRIVSCNKRFDEFFQCQVGELENQSLERFFPDTAQFLAIRKQALKVIGANNSYREQLELKRKDGSLFWAEINGRAIDPNNPESGSIWIIADISDRRRVEEKSAKLLQAVEQSPTSIVITDRNGVIEYVNPFFTQITGYSAAEAIGQTPRVLKSDETPRATYEDLWRTILGGEIWRGVLRNRCKDGLLIWERTSISPIFDVEGEITHFVAVKEDITEQRWIEQQLEEHQERLEELVLERTTELEQALEAAKVADRTKDEFLANITHDLRTPLNAVIGFASLARPLSTDATLVEYLDKINRAGQTLSSLINDLLDLSKIAAGRMELDLQPFSLRQLIAHCLSTISYKAKEKGLILTKQIDEQIPDVLIGDGLRIEQIMLNLLSNAVKFTPAGQVSLRISQAKTLESSESSIRLTIEVQDSGIGMSKAVIAKLFEPFRQGDASMTRRFGGTGLGLVICQRLVTLMDGEINVSSEEHHGSLFTLTLPLRLGIDLLSVEAEDEQAATDVRYEEVKMLVADDQPLNRDLVHGLLNVVGIRPNFARNGQEAVDILEHSTESYDLVLMDIQMPTMDGLTATLLIRKNTRFARLPIIALTAHTMLHEKEACQQAGMNDHIGKPFNEKEFFKILAKWIPSSKQRRQSEIDAPALPQQQSACLPNIAGIDMSEGLALMQGDATRYRHWLRMFLQQAPMLIGKAREALLAGETDQASMAAHTLKGSTGLLGMKELHASAAKLETTIDQAQPATELANALEQDIRAMCSEIIDKLGLEENAEPVTNAPSQQEHGLPTGVRPDCLKRLIASLDRGDGNCDRYVAQCLEELSGTAWVPFLEKAQENILNFDFQTASQLLSDPGG